MIRRSKEKGMGKPKQDMTQYYAVGAFFVACMAGAAISTLMNP